MGAEQLSATDREVILEDHIRQIELSRVRALLTRDMELAWRLHAPDYQLITPSGVVFSRERYLGKIASGELAYLQWKPEHMQVRLSETMAIVRYRATLELDAGDGRGTPFECWHTDSYELNAGDMAGRLVAGHCIDASGVASARTRLSCR